MTEGGRMGQQTADKAAIPTGYPWEVVVVQLPKNVVRAGLLLLAVSCAANVTVALAFVFGAPKIVSSR